MPVTAVLGAQWGDEGKGKIVDFLAQDADVVIRATGGNNAGHTIHNEYGEFALHLVPGGIFNPRATCIIGSGTVVDPKSLLAELQTLEDEDIAFKGRLYISPKAHLVMPWHIALDDAEERRRDTGGVKIGTTLRGIGPAFADKASRKGLRIRDLACLSGLSREFRALYDEKCRFLEREYNYMNLPDFFVIWNQYLDFARKLAPFIRDTEPIVWDALDHGKNILLEGAQGALLDIDHGMYPFVTSTACTTAGVLQGAGIPPGRIDRIIGVVKAYSTRIAAGPFPTEASEDIAELLRTKGNEFGATTGRPRRCGWLDLPLLRYTTAFCGFTEIALTKMDILSCMSQIPIATAYAGYDSKGVPSPLFCASAGDKAVIPWYEHHPGWDADLSELSDWRSFPSEAVSYVRKIESFLGVRVRYVSNGPGREQLVEA